MDNIPETILKIMGLTIILIFTYFIAMLVFLAAFDDAQHVTDESDMGVIGAYVVYVAPLLLVVLIALKTFNGKNRT